MKGVEIAATEELLSVPEVGDRLGVSVYTVRRWIKSGDLAAYRPGKEYRVRESELEKFLEAHRPKAAALPSPEAPNGEERRREKYLLWLEFVTCYADRWEEKLSKGLISHAELQEMFATLRDIGEVTGRLWQEEERLAAPGEDEFSENKVMWKVVKRDMQLLKSGLRVAKQQFEESELTQLRREKERLEAEWSRAADG